LLVAVWIVGTLAGLAYTALGFVSARRLLCGSRPCMHPAWLESLARVRHDMRLGRHVELRVTARSISPAVWSFRRVQILLPADSLTWPASVRRSVLLHELAHVARHDCASQMIGNLACAVWWIHPLVWYGAGRMRALGELAADDYVIRATGRPTDYAHELLAIAAALGWARLPTPVQTMFHPSHLERRLRAILDPARRRNGLSTRRSLAGILTACGLMIPLATLTTSVVRAVPRPAVQQPQPARVDVYLRLRVSVPVTPIRFGPGDYRRYFLPADPNAPLQPVAPGKPQPPAALPPATFQLLPNWDVDRRAAMLIPNYEQGMARVVLVQVQQLQAAAPAAVAATSVSAGATRAPLAVPDSAAPYLAPAAAAARSPSRVPAVP
jgi:beta-lactamase regulating signal transducer with metallopeptidase domain